MNKLFLFLIILVITGFSNVSQQTETYQLIVFEGSDWCSSCRKFEKEILQDSLVQSYIKQYAIEIVKVDFPQRKQLSPEKQKENKQLAEKYNFQGFFPTIIIASDSMYAKLSSNKITPHQFIDWLKIEALKNR